MKRHWLFLTVVALALASCHTKDFDEALALEVQAYTRKQCPTRIDSSTVIDSVVYNLHTRTLQYCYTLDNELDNKEVLTQEVCEQFREHLVQSLCNSIELKEHKEHDVAFEYRYYSRTDGSLLMQIQIGPDDYKSR